MDAPLLALTRNASSVGSSSPPGHPAAENMCQLIQLRWIAVAGQLLAILISYYGLDVPLPFTFMIGIIVLLALANLAFSGAVSPMRTRLHTMEHWLWGRQLSS